MSELRLPRRNLVVWFEIPVRQLEPAMAFYNDALGLHFRLERRAGQTRAIIDQPEFANTGALFEAPERIGSDGVRLYLHAGGALSRVLQRVVRAGGRIHADAASLGGDYGQVAVIEDPDGNRIGLHSPTPLPATAADRPSGNHT